MNRFYDGIDLVGKEIYINFKNALGDTGNSQVLKEHIALSDNILEFDWWVSDKITILSGNVEIQVEICSYDESGDVTYRYQTIPFLITIEKTLISDGSAESGDYYLDISFYNKIENILSYDMASSLPTLEIKNRCIIMPTLKDIVITKDSNSRIIHFSIQRYIDKVDLSEKVICIKFKLSNNTGDRSIVCNKVISPTTIEFDWLLDSRVTLLSGTVEFAIEFIGYNEHHEFYCWNTLPAIFTISQGLDVDDIIEQPTPSWIQSWNILADKYLKDYLTYIEQIKENIQIAVDGAERSEKWAKAAKESEILAGQEANSAFEYASKAEEAKNIVLSTKADFDIKYQNFLTEIPKLYESDEKLSNRIFALEKPIFNQQNGFTNITSGETLQNILGKIAGWNPYISENITNLQNNKADKTQIPSTLPANGGNADTVDNMHAIDFVQNKKQSITIADLNNPYYPVPFFAEIPNGTEIGLSNHWYHVAYFAHGNNDGFGAEIAISLNTEKKMYFRNSEGNRWSEWQEIITSATIGSQNVNYANSSNNANNANTVGGHMAQEVVRLGGKHLAGQGAGGGYSFVNDGAEDTGMFSDNDGDLYFLQNGVKWYASHNGHTHNYIPTNASCNKNWNWSGQGGQPDWVWGGCDGTNMYVYNPLNFRVAYASDSGGVEWGNVRNKPSSYSPSGHIHYPSDITGGQLGGYIYAPRDNNYSNARLRNIYAGSYDLTAGVSPLANGDIYICFE